MSLDRIGQAGLAYFIAEKAPGMDFADKWNPRGELNLVWADKIEVALRKFGRKVRTQSKAIAIELLDYLIANDAYANRENEYGGAMHSFRQAEYRKAIAALQDSNPLVQEARGAGEGFWEQKFSEITGD